MHPRQTRNLTRNAYFGSLKIIHDLFWLFSLANFSWQTSRELIRESLKCDLNDDFDEIEIEQCHVETLQNWWYGCLGDYCGATLPEGVCAEKCIPPLEEGIALCDGKIPNDFLALTQLVLPIRIPVIPYLRSGPILIYF